MGNRGPPTLADARSEWLADARFRRLSSRTIDEYERVSGHVVAFISTQGHREAALADLTAGRVREWIGQRPLKPASVAACLSNDVRHMNPSESLNDLAATLASSVGTEGV